MINPQVAMAVLIGLLLAPFAFLVYRDRANLRADFRARRVGSRLKWVAGFFRRRRVGLAIATAFLLTVSLLINEFGLIQPGTLIVRDTTYIARHMLGRWPSTWEESVAAYRRYWRWDTPDFYFLEPYWDRVDYEPLDASTCIVRTRGRNGLGWPTEVVDTLDYTEELERQLAREEESNLEARPGR